MRTRLWTVLSAVVLAACGTDGAPDPGGATTAGGPGFAGAPREVKLMTLDPGHFHAALVQKSMYSQVDPRVHVFAPEGPDVQDHLARIEGFNSRPADPTEWIQVVYTGGDYLERMLAESPGNVVVLSGNNSRKAEYVLQAVRAGLHVLADKPMAIRAEEFSILEEALGTAEAKGVVLDDIMTERHEITSILQRRLSQSPALFGELTAGTPAEPAVAKESVHHFSKLVSGKALRRPAWFFDVRQQGEGLVDVTTHLIDLIHWQCFPGQGIDHETDIDVLSARRWATELTPDEFQKVTGLSGYPAYLAGDVGPDSVLSVYSNGEIRYAVKGVHAKVSVEWRYRAPEGAGDTHRSVMRGSKATLSVRQGPAEGYEPTLYVEPAEGVTPGAVETVLLGVVSDLAEDYPGLEVTPTASGWTVVIPDEYKVGHEAHFAQVTEKYLRSLVAGRLSPGEKQNILAKYFVTTRAWELAASRRR